MSLSYQESIYASTIELMVALHIHTYVGMCSTIAWLLGGEYLSSDLHMPYHSCGPAFPWRLLRQNECISLSES